MPTFAELGLSPKIIAALTVKGFEEPTEIQALTIPLLIKNETDIIAQANTGTGKTAAFALPLIEKLSPTARHVQAIILAPTRELVIQICEEFNSLKGGSAISVAPVYGGQSISLQLHHLHRGVSVVVGTPGRIIDHLERGSLKLEKISHFILDEADEMLNMGFIDDIEKILEHTPKEKRVLLFSATMPQRIKLLAEKYMGKYVQLRAQSALTTALTNQIYFEVAYQDKFEALCRIIDMEDDFYGIIFCRTKVEVDELTNHLLDRGYEVDALHGDITQMQREKILGKFRKRRIAILAATDVAARGIDVNNLSHVINYSLPQNPESYIHRIGRTGRAGNQGTAVTFVTPAEFYKLGFIKQVARVDIHRKNIPEVSHIMDKRKDKIAADVIKLAATEQSAAYKEWAQKILTDNPPEDIVAALLNYSFKKTLDESVYKKLLYPKNRAPQPHSKTTASPEDDGTTRLFIARGLKDNITRKSLIDFIVKQTRIHEHLIGGIDIRDTFSFITVPFAEAEKILAAFKTAGGNRSIITRAKPKEHKPAFAGKRSPR